MKRLLGMVISFALTAVVAGFFCRFDVDPHHDGIFLKPAVDMLRGQHLFKDTFSIYGPLTSLFHFGILRLFGPSLLLLKLATALVYGFIGALLFATASLLLPFGIALGTVFLWVVVAPYYEPGVTFFIWPSVYALLFQMVTVVFLLLWIRQPKTIFLIAAGFSSALVVWFRQPVGLLLYLAVCTYFVMTKAVSIRKTGLFHLSFFGINMLAVLLLALYGVIRDWFFQSVVFVSWWHSAVLGGRIFPIVLLEKLLPLSYSPVSIWVLLPAAAGFALWKKIKKDEIILLALVGIASWMQYYPMNDIHHIYWAATPFFPVLVWLFYSYGKGSRRIFVALSILLTLFLPDIYNRARMIKHKLSGSYITVEKPALLRHMLVRPDAYAEIQKMEKKIQVFERKNPDGVVITNGPRVLFTTFAKNQTNCHPFTSNWGWEVYNASFNAEYLHTLAQCSQRLKRSVLVIK
jgi:hypothetical protein